MAKNDPQVVIWAPGGSPESMSATFAIEYLRSILDERETAWEYRVPGEEIDQDWHDFPTLREAVRKAWPESHLWGEALNIKDEVLAFLGMEANLILSTGVECSDLYGDGEQLEEENED